MSKNLGKSGRRLQEGHDLVRRTDRQEDVLIWCRKYSGYARQRIGPKLINCCRPEQMGTKEFWQNAEKQTLEGRVLAQEARNWRIDVKKKRITRKEDQRLVNKIEMEGAMAQEGLWNLAKGKIVKESGELPNETGDAVREYKATHEQNFCSNWLRENERGKEERMATAETNEDERGVKRTREEEQEENETRTVKRRCEGSGSVETFEIFGQGGDLESCGDLSWEDPLEEFENWSGCEFDSRARVRMVLDVTDVLVSPSSVVTDFCDVSSCC